MGVETKGDVGLLQQAKSHQKAPTSFEPPRRMKKIKFIFDHYVVFGDEEKIEKIHKAQLRL